MTGAKEYTSSGFIQGAMQNHYGVTVDLTKPTTGVQQANVAEWIDDEIVNGIDLAWDEHEEECTNEEHYECGPEERGTVLIGSWFKNQAGQYEPDTAGEYAAIVGEIYVQVVWSRHTKRCRPCSPCYPGQGDLGTPCDEGGFIAFDLPPDVYGDGKED